MSRLPKIFLYLSVPLYLLDQASKWWAVSHFSEPTGNHLFSTPDKPMAVIDGFLWWWRIHNQGVAFGMGNGTAWAPYVFLLVLIAALILITVFWQKGAFANRSARLAAALLVAGVAGNLTDRLVQGFVLERYRDEPFLTRLAEGYVVDFIHVKLPGYEKIAKNSDGFFPTFNVADSCISIAAGLLFFSAFRPEDEKS